MPREHAQQRTCDGRHNGVAEVVQPNLPIAVAQRFERAHLHALILNHARQRVDDNHRRDRENQHREQVGQTAEHADEVTR